MPFDEYFWRLKHMFPGDPEFTWENFSSLPYPYVVSAYVRGHSLYRERLHDNERPVAMVSAILANQNRDPKRTKKPYSWEDYSFYRPYQGKDVANYVYGSAMMQMAKHGKLPPWALFCFREITSSASSTYIPENCAFVAEDAMLLHPIKVGDGWEGLLIALESASNKDRCFVADDGTEVRLRVPHIHTKAIAEEGVVLLNR